MTRKNRVLDHLAVMHHARRIFERNGTTPAEELARYAGLMGLAEDKLRLGVRAKGRKRMSTPTTSG